LRHVFRISPGTTWADTDVADYHFAGYAAHPRSVHSFVSSIVKGEDVVCSGEDGLEAVRLVVASYESARSGLPVTVENVESTSLRQAVAG